MSDWQVGDLAVCVDDATIMCPGGYYVHLGTAYKRGAVLRVGALHLNPDCGCPVLLGAMESDPSFQGGIAKRFRKIEPSETEFKTLLKRKRVSA